VGRKVIVEATRMGVDRSSEFLFKVFAANLKTVRMIQKLVPLYAQQRTSPFPLFRLEPPKTGSEAIWKLHGTYPDHIESLSKVFKKTGKRKGENIDERE
jgi:hypothetical protein